ncbi:hypothetical protein FACS189446_0440 [Bacteroidia bacterium]|nr:hypothetical protein FACS189446_0440 [Bacteroidia bacterium]
MKITNYMNKQGTRNLFVYLAMFILVLSAYKIFYNKAFLGDEIRGRLVWLSSSTVKFVNYWLEENPSDFNFLMLEYPKSIEFNGFNDREPYISYPSGTIFPPYLMAKMLHKNEIDLGFVKHFLAIKYFLDTFLVCLIFFGLLTYCLKIRHIKWAALTSVVLSISWMCLPINLYYERNVFFSDQCIITVVLFYILLEIYDEYFRSKALPIKSLYYILKFCVSLFGAFTDYYFLFVIFIAWLIKIVPLFKVKKGKIKSILSESGIYVLPVLIGLSLFIIQILSVLNWWTILRGRYEERTHSEYSTEHENPAIVFHHFVSNYSSVGLLLCVILFIACLFLFVKSIKNKQPVNLRLFKILLLIFIPPILHVIVFTNHSAVHELSMEKFALPFILIIFLSVWYIFKRIPYTKFPIFYPLVIICFAGLLGYINLSRYAGGFYNLSINENYRSYEMEHLIKDHIRYDDVYFSFTDSIVANPPMSLSISDKAVHKIEHSSDIAKLFPNLDKNARILLVVRKNNTNKSPEIIAREKIHINSLPLFESKNYAVYLGL